MKKILTMMLLVLVCSIIVQAQDADYQPLYFPTGTVWEEVIIDPYPLDTIHSNLYEIGGDTIINEKNYKCVLLDGQPRGLWVREQDGIVWVLSDLYPSDIKIYDFNWDGITEYSFEYLSIDYETGDREVKTCTVPTSHTSNVVYNGETYWYVANALFGDTIVNKIGRIRDVDLDCALLGTIMYEPVLPGLIYSKVLWIKRKGEIIYDAKPFEKAVLCKRADINHDGQVDISDVNGVINMMLGKSDIAPVDVTGDGQVDISDVNLVINAMLGK